MSVQPASSSTNFFFGEAGAGLRFRQACLVLTDRPRTLISFSPDTLITFSPHRCGVATDVEVVAALLEVLLATSGRAVGTATVATGAAVAMAVVGVGDAAVAAVIGTTNKVKKRKTRGQEAPLSPHTSS